MLDPQRSDNRVGRKKLAVAHPTATAAAEVHETVSLIETRDIRFRCSTEIRDERIAKKKEEERERERIGKNNNASC